MHFRLEMLVNVLHVMFCWDPSVGFCFFLVLLIQLVVVVAMVVAVAVAAAFVGDQIPNLVPVGQVVHRECSQ